MARRKLIAGNWKMNLSLQGAVDLARDIAAQTASDAGAPAIAVFPPTCFVDAVNQQLFDTHVAVGAQNVHPEDSGAFTGEVSAKMLADLQIIYVLCGHSERRHVFGESSAFVGQKVAAALRANLTPVLCVGETLAERERDVTEAIVGEQLEQGFVSIASADYGRVVIAYEPVWAIGTGKNATPEQAQAVHAFIRGWLRARVAATADDMHILYGGSVKASNADDLLSQPDVDGALVGGASLDAAGFAAIARAG